MAKARISLRTVGALVPAEKDYFVWDTELAGFGIKVTPLGKIVYLIQYRTGGRSSPTKRYTIGVHGPLTPDDARREAKALLGGIQTGTSDPATEKASKRKESTVADLADRYYTEYVMLHNKPRTQEEVKRILDRRIKPVLGKLKIGDVSRVKIKDWHHSMRETPYEANRALAYCSKMFSLAVRDWELRPDNPCMGIRKFKEHKLERFYSDEELGKIGEVLRTAKADKSELDGVINAITLLALTGCRLSEILTLKWEYVNLDTGLLLLPDTKTGARAIPLNDAARALLQSMEREGDYVVFGYSSDMPLTEGVLQSAWKRIREKADLMDVRLHDFRHTAGTYAAQAGFNAFMVRDLLGHKTLAMTGRYVEKAADPMRATANAVGSRVSAALGERHDVVVEMTGSRNKKGRPL